MRRRLALLLIAPLLGGCLQASILGPASDESDPLPLVAADWAERALPWGADHDHQNASHHRGLSTPNFEILGWDPLETAYHGATSGSYTCGQTATVDGRTIAYTVSFETDVAFVGVDVTDPANPRKVSEFALPTVKTYDLTVTPDGKYVVLGTSRLDRGDFARDPPGNTSAAAGVAASLPAEASRSHASGHEFADPARALGGGPRPCAETAFAEQRAAEAEAPEDATPYVGGVVVVDVQDPANPRVVDYFPQPVYGVHSVFATEADGRTLLLASNVNGLTTFGTAALPIGSLHAVSYFSFFEIVEGKLELLSVYRPPPADPARAPIRNGHLDGTIAKHPVTNETIATLADWDGGVTILGLADPARPQLLGQWSPYRFSVDERYAGKIHNAVPLPGLWDGRHYTIAGQEVTTRPEYTPTGQIFLLDTTDPTNPFWVSSWTLPADVQWTARLLFSLHYFAVHERTLFVTAYHAGMWAVDLTDVERPRTAGVFVPDRDAASLYGEVRYGAPSVEDVFVLPGGELVTFDEQSGAYTLRFHKDVQLPAIAEWPVLEPDAG